MWYNHLGRTGSMSKDNSIVRSRYYDKYSIKNKYNDKSELSTLTKVTSQNHMDTGIIGTSYYDTTMSRYSPAAGPVSPLATPQMSFPSSAEVGTQAPGCPRTPGCLSWKN